MEQTGPPRRILFFNTEAELYGGERCLLEVVQRMGPGWEPRFVLPGPGRFERALRECGHEVDEFAIPPGLVRSESRRLPTVLRLARLIRRRRADLVHLNLHFAWPIVSPACLVARVPLVIHVRNMLTGHPGRLDRLLFQRAAAVICISQAVRQRVLDLELVRPGRPPRVELIPDGRVLARYQQGDGEQVRRELGIPRESPLVGIVARLEPMKGQDLFLQMAAIVAQRVPEVRFLIVGDTMGRQQGDYLRQLEDLARQPALAGRVSFLGFRDDVADVLAALDCFVHPSRRGAFVSVLIEAMAAGVPIVASDVDGIPECVGREGAAELVGTLDARSFAEATCRVLTDADHSARMRRLGRERAQRLFDIGPLARRTEEVFAACLPSPG